MKSNNDIQEFNVEDYSLPMIVKGHCAIEDDLGNVLLDKDNAVHPQNMSRIIARALSNENNYIIHRLAFGNGGTDIDAAFTVTFKSPNDGQPPDTQTWGSRLYNETYSEIIDDSATLGTLGTDPGSADVRVGIRPGGGAVPADDTATNFVESESLGLTSLVKIEVMLNPSEPTGQLTNDQTSNTSLNSSFTFDEIGLFTTGAPARNSTGVQDIDVGDKTSTDRTALIGGDPYDFNIKVDGAATFANISFIVPLASHNPTYGELIEALRDPSGVGNAWNISQQLPADSIVSITDTTFGTYPSISGDQTFGFLRFISNTSGDISTIELAAGTNDMFVALPGTILPAENGANKGVVDDINNPSTEQERLLTHLIFTPVLKAANRTLRITYTLTIAVARSVTT